MLSDRYDVLGISADDNFAFVMTEDRENDEHYGARVEKREYELFLLDGDQMTNMTDILKEQTPSETNGDFSIYEYLGYLFYVDNSLEKSIPQIVYIEKDDFRYSCLPYNTYLKNEGELVRIDLYLKGLPEVQSGFGGINASHVYGSEGCCYFIAQYGRGTFEYQYNPGPGLIATEFLGKYDYNTQEISILYETVDTEQLVGYSIPNDKILILTNDSLYEKSLSSDESRTLLEFPAVQYPVDADQFFFDCYNGETYIFVMRPKSFSKELKLRYRYNE